MAHISSYSKRHSLQEDERVPVATDKNLDKTREEEDDMSE
jgi:hypothetical protein